MLNKGIVLPNRVDYKYILDEGKLVFEWYDLEPMRSIKKKVCVINVL